MAKAVILRRVEEVGEPPQYDALVQQGTLKTDLARHEVYDGAR